MSGASVASDVSAASKPLDCPCCNKQIAARSIFLHIKSKHSGYFQQQTTKKWLTEAQLGKPLKIFWEKKNDFDEPELIVLFGCLSSGKTFNYEHKGITHFKKNPNDLKEHNTQIKGLLAVRGEQLEEERKEQQKLALTPPDKSEFVLMKNTNDPELLDALRWVIQNHLTVCEKLAKDAQEYLNPIWTTYSPETPGAKKTQTVKETLATLDLIKNMISNKPDTYKILNNILFHLYRFLHLRKFFNGSSAPDLTYPWFVSLDHPEGELSLGTSRFARYIWPWERPGFTTSVDFLINNPVSWIECTTPAN